MHPRHVISLLIHGFLSVNARLLIASGTDFYAILSDNLPKGKVISILTQYRTKMQIYCDIFSKDYFEADVERSACLHATSSRRESLTL